MRKIVASGLAAAALLAVTGCQSVKDQQHGVDHGFDGVGKVVRVRDHTYDVRFTSVKIADGRSYRHVKVGQVASIHDNRDTCGWHSRKWEGPRAKTVPVGKIVHVVGARVRNEDVCGKHPSHSWRLVGRSVELVPQ